MNNYDFIILPPEGFNFYLSWPLHKLRQRFKSLIYMVTKYKKQEQTLLIKYRAKKQKKFYPVNDVYNALDDKVGSFLEYCHDKTIVIGPSGSACIEALKSNIRYFSYEISPYPNNNNAYYSKLNSVLFVAKNNKEIIENINSNRIYREGASINDLLHTDGLYLEEIVKFILNK